MTQSIQALLRDLRQAPQELAVPHLPPVPVARRPGWRRRVSEMRPAWILQLPALHALAPYGHMRLARLFKIRAPHPDTERLNTTLINWALRSGMFSADIAYKAAECRPGYIASYAASHCSWAVQWSIGTAFLFAIAVDDSVIERGLPLDLLKRACDDSLRDGNTAHAQTPFSCYLAELRREMVAMGGVALLPQLADEQQLLFLACEQEQRYIKDDSLPTVTEYLKQRIRTFALHPTLQIQRCERGHLPPHRHFCDRLRWLADLAALLQALDNDIIGCQRDIENNFPMNIIPVLALEFQVDLPTAYLMSLDLVEMLKPVFDALVEDVCADPGEFPEAATQARSIAIWPDAFHTYHQTTGRYQLHAEAADAALPPEHNYRTGPLLRALKSRNQGAAPAGQDPPGSWPDWAAALFGGLPFARLVQETLTSAAPESSTGAAAASESAAASSAPAAAPEPSTGAAAPPEPAAAAPELAAPAPPPDFPAAIPVRFEPGRDQAVAIVGGGAWVCEPRDTAEVVTLANWAKAQGRRLQPRGDGHNAAPPTAPRGSDASQVVLVDTQKHLNHLALASTDPAAVQAGAGATLLALLTFLEERGYGLATAPGSGDATLGGLIATGAHGSSVAVPGQVTPLGHNNGALSNLVVAFTAVVFDAEAGQYAARTFDRAHPESAALLVHLGGAFLTEVTLRVGANQMLRCQSDVSLPASEVLGPPDDPTPGRFASLVQRAGRVEVLVYPFHDRTWVKTWTPASGPTGARPVTEPYNYPFNDHLPEPIAAQSEQVVHGAPELAPVLSALLHDNLAQGLAATAAADLIGPSKNLLLQERADARRLTRSGHVICTRRADLQRVVHQIGALYRERLAAHQKEGSFPINGPLELRASSLDDAAGLELRGAAAAALSPSAPHGGAEGFDVALFVGVSTLPGTPGADRFYREFEALLFSGFQPPYAVVRPEWSSGWAYTDAGPYTNEDVLKAAIPSAFGASFDLARARLAACDPHRVFSNDLLDRVFPSDGASAKSCTAA